MNDYRCTVCQNNIMDVADAARCVIEGEKYTHLRCLIGALRAERDIAVARAEKAEANGTVYMRFPDDVRVREDRRRLCAALTEIRPHVDMDTRVTIDAALSAAAAAFNMMAPSPAPHAEAVTDEVIERMVRALFADLEAQDPQHHCYRRAMRAALGAAGRG